MQKTGILVTCFFLLFSGYAFPPECQSIPGEKMREKGDKGGWSFLFAKNENSKNIADSITEKKLHNKRDTFFALQEFGVSTGYGRASIHKGPYEFVPFALKWGFNLKPLFSSKEGFLANSILLLMVEPHVGFVYYPEKNAEIGVNLLVKYGLFFTPAFLGFIEGGPGAIYMTHHTREQSTQGNFASQIGVGIQYLWGEKRAIEAAYRFRHVSNASIESPNQGINSHIFILGFSLFY